MLKAIRILALICALAVVTTWAMLGANSGWTKNSIVTIEKDPITEIEFPAYKPGFVPGVDFLAAGLAGSCLLFGVTFIFQKFLKTKSPTL